MTPRLTDMGKPICGDAPTASALESASLAGSDVLWPVYVFRPLPDFFYLPDGVRRYADGKWIADDGEPDLAFIGNRCCLMVELPFQRNIVLKWLTGHWDGHEPLHPGGNPWHYMLRDGTTGWGGEWKGWRRHPNRVAGDSGMSEACRGYGCSNGRCIQFTLGDPHIAAGLVRERDTGRMVTFPENPVCMYCGDAWRAKVKASDPASGATANAPEPGASIPSES